MQGTFLGNLGSIYVDLGKYERAIIYHEKALSINREIGDTLGESYDLSNLGASYTHMEIYDKAVHHYQEALILRQESGVPYLIEQTERNLERVRQLQSGQGGSGVSDDDGE